MTATASDGKPLQGGGRRGVPRGERRVELADLIPASPVVDYI